MRSLIAFTILACIEATAFADAKAEAKEHLKRAGIAHKEKRYDEALTELKISYTLDPQPALLYAIGQVHVARGECDQAITFYQRFLDAKPEERQAAKASEAIETCKRLEPEPVKVVEPPKADEPVKVVDPPNVVAPPTGVVEPSPWYADWPGAVLVGGGVVSGVASLVMFRAARSDSDKADNVTRYDAYDSLVDSAHDKQTYSMIFAAAGGALVTLGILRYALHDRGGGEQPAVSVVPRPQGGLVSWTARF